MSKKNILIAVGAGLVVILLALSSNAQLSETVNLDVEFGQYEQRIDSGLYTGAPDAKYIKAATDIGVIGGLGLSGEIEYVDGSDTVDDETYASVGTTLDTVIGTVDAGVLFTKIGDADIAQELYASYVVSLLGVNTLIDASLEEGQKGVVDALVGTSLVSGGDIDVSVGAQVGGSYNYDVDYKYTLGFIRATLVESGLYAQYNYLKNDLSSSEGTDNEWIDTLDIGFAFNF